MTTTTTAITFAAFTAYRNFLPAGIVPAGVEVTVEWIDHESGRARVSCDQGRGSLAIADVDFI